MNGSPEDVQGLINDLQSQTKIPLLVAANCDSGGDGAVKGGTYISSGAQSEASRDTWVPYHVGLVSAREETALGVNVNFDPCVDILQNWRNTIVNTRAYGTTAEDASPIAQTIYRSTGISTYCPSTTPIGLALGPD